MRRLKTSVYLLVALVAFTMCCPSAGAQEGKYVLKGTLVTPDTVIENGIVVIEGEKIQAVGSNVNVPSGASIIDAAGIILPGFVDLHNHLTWNVFPRWRPNKQFNNRYEWQQFPMYGVSLSTPHAELFRKNLGCDMNRYAEVKAITEGETSLVGSLDPPEKCIEGLARNLDFSSGFYEPGALGAEKLVYAVFPLELDASAVARVNDALDKKELTALVVHLAEGKPTDASSAREFKMLVARGFLREGVTIIHGVALRPADFRQMADKKVGLIWSPRSNLELYGATTDVASALRERVRIALSPDWSPTGSDGMLEELRFASAWNSGQAVPVFTNKELVRMATDYAAQLAGISDKIGTLAPRYYADLLVLNRIEKDPYETVVHAGPADVKLVVIDGEPVYGDPVLMKKLLPNQRLEMLTVCGVQKAFYFGSEARLQGTTPKSWKQTTDDLSLALKEWGSSLAPLADCAN